MNALQQQNQLELDFGTLGQPRRERSSEALIATRMSESPTGTIRLMESVCERQNMRRALRQVRKNKGAPGIDGMTVEELPGYLKRHWPRIKAELLAGAYTPMPVRRKELEKRGLHFVRFADDSVIYVKSKCAGDRVMKSVSRFITRKLKLKVNEAKSSVTQPGYTKYLGFGFTISKTNP